jgi:valyl-tRNA synthetase
MTLPGNERLTLADRWILTRLHDTAIEVGTLLDGFDFGVAAETLWKFIWYELCDWYIEASKESENLGTRAAVLSFVMNNAMRLLHPLEPFITEEIWLALPHDGQTIVTAAWPDPEEIPADREAERTFTTVRRTVERLRNERAENTIADSTRVPVSVPEGHISAAVRLVLHLARGEAVAIQSQASAAESLDDVLASMRVQIDRDALIDRYRRETGRLESEVERGEKKLGNEQFVSKAAPELVAKEREKLANYRSELERLRQLLASAGDGTRRHGKEGS